MTVILGLHANMAVDVRKALRPQQSVHNLGYIVAAHKCGQTV